MDTLQLFGSFAVTRNARLVTRLEDRDHTFSILAFAGRLARLGSIYGFLQGAWPFGLG